MQLTPTSEDIKALLASNKTTQLELQVIVLERLLREAEAKLPKVG